MSSVGSVSQWLRGIRVGDELQLGKLWQRYWPKLVSLAHSKMRDTPSRVADQEDVAQGNVQGFGIQTPEHSLVALPGYARLSQTADENLTFQSFNLYVP